MAKSSRSANQSFAFSVVTFLFFAFGFITCLNDILVPHLKDLFTLDYTRAALVQFCFFSAYFFASAPAGKLITRIGYKKSTVVGLLITAAGCLIFYPAAGMRSYNLFLFGLFVLASGVTLIQVAVNPYVTALGPAKTASSRLNLSQAFNSLGTTLAPLFGTALILTALTQVGVDPAHSIQGPYLGLAVALIVLAGIVGAIHLPDVGVAGAADSHVGAGLWRYRHLVLGTVGIFCYVGAEVAIGSYLINFLGLSEVMAYTPSEAGRYVSVYWGGAMVGRFIGAGVLQKVSPNRVLAFSAGVAGLLLAVAMVAQGELAMFAVLSIGLFNAVQFPTIFTLAIADLGKKTPQASGLLCMAIVGGAVIPLLQGMLADRVGLQHSFVLAIVCYLYIVYYGARGYRTR